jgi:hypothetical protein
MVKFNINFCTASLCLFNGWRDFLGSIVAEKSNGFASTALNGENRAYFLFSPVDRFVKPSTDSFS